MKPYIITDETTTAEIADMIQRAYDEGYADGYLKAKAETPVFSTTPATQLNITDPCYDSDRVKITC